MSDIPPVSSKRTVLLLPCVLSFNVDQKNSLSFEGPLEDMFGYTVQQFENSEGKCRRSALLVVSHVAVPGGSSAVMI
ncbi:Integrin alpha-1 [Liparis tanakae]|uniref:Integrin alpha-1 n=1 Tax=Liparis tanakae TaxID=230148 RepID=A0A4Z2FW93_9TELE|nr:Integrin alpha-1 [Liparis tanakae]